jgi:hypothetical protein
MKRKVSVADRDVWFILHAAGVQEISEHEFVRAKRALADLSSEYAAAALDELANSETWSRNPLSEARTLLHKCADEYRGSMR